MVILTGWLDGMIGVATGTRTSMRFSNGVSGSLGSLDDAGPEDSAGSAFPGDWDAESEPAVFVALASEEVLNSVGKMSESGRGLSFGVSFATAPVHALRRWA